MVVKSIFKKQPQSSQRNISWVIISKFEWFYDSSSNWRTNPMECADGI